VWQSEGRVTDRGYIVFITIPFKSLRFSDAADQAWSIALGRHIAAASEQAFWPYITRRVEGFVNQLAELDGLREIAPGHNAQLVPYAALTRGGYLDRDAPAFLRSDGARIGLDSKTVLRDAFTLDVTINPDFSQVESDDPQVTVNTRFEVFVPEKRPFFTENAGLFATPEQLLFSRRVADPQFGARLTGKAGRWAIGALVVDDRAPGAAEAAGDTPAGRRAANAAVRVQREVGRESSMGLFAAAHELASGFNRVIAADTRIKVGPTWSLTAQVIGSIDQPLNGVARQGGAGNATLTRGGRHFTYVGSYLDRSPDFRARLGFIERVDVRETVHYASYYWFPQSGPLLSFGPSGSASIDWNYAGRRQDWNVQPQIDFYFRRQYGVSLYRSESYESFSAADFRYDSTTLSGYSNQSKRLAINGAFGWGTSPTYAPAGGVQPFVGASRSGSLGVTLRPVPRLRIEEAYHYSRLGFAAGAPVTQATPPVGTFIGGSLTDETGRAPTLTGLTTAGAPLTKLFANHISRTKVNLQFTRALSVRAIADFYTLDTASALIQDERSRRLTADVLLTYLVNPFTALYVGYSERYENVVLDTDALDRPALRLLRRASTRAAHQLFMKVSYRIGL
jgi:hypothetical protein